MVVYLLLNMVTGMAYIGYTSNLSHRISSHRNCHKGKTRSRSYLHNAIAQYGFDKFKLFIIDYADSYADLKGRERYWIAFFDTKRPGGYNLTDGGDGTNGMILTDDHKQKIGAGVKRTFATTDAMQKSIEGRKKYWADPIHIEEASKRFQGEKNPRFGAKWDDEHLKLFSEKKKGLYDGKNNPNYGNKVVWTEEQKKTQSDRIKAIRAKKNWSTKKKKK